MGKAFDSIAAGLRQAIAHGSGKGGDVVVYRPQQVDVAGLRQCVGMTQEQFAARFGMSVATLRHWERGDRQPAGPALVLLNLIERNPKAVLQALR